MAGGVGHEAAGLAVGGERLRGGRAAIPGRPLGAHGSRAAVGRAAAGGAWEVICGLQAHTPPKKKWRGGEKNNKKKKKEEEEEDEDEDEEEEEEEDEKKKEEEVKPYRCPLCVHEMN